MSGIATAIIGGSVISGVVANEGNKRAIGAQEDAARRAEDVQERMFEQQREDLADYREAGSGALERLEGGQLDITQDPGYQFRLDEGMKAINAAAAARGRSAGGATLKQLARYGQDYASQEYGNAWNRQMQLANMGQSAAAGQAAAAGNYGQSMSNLYQNLGQAQAGSALQGGQTLAGMVGGIGQGLGYALGGADAAKLFSDERLKTDIEEITSEDLKEMKKHLKAYIFKYVNSDHGKGQWVGVMAQDLEKSKLGRTLVEVDGQGRKFINKDKVMSLYLATLAEG